MGKREYAERLYKDFDFIHDLEKDAPENINCTGKILVLNLQAGVKSLLSRDIDCLEFFESRLEFLRDSVLIGDEISGGVIPIDKFERQWRDETGKLYKFLAREAETVDRIFAGLSMRLKG